MRLIKVELMKLKRMFIIQGAALAPIIAIMAGVGVAPNMISKGVTDYWRALWSMSAFTLGGVVIPIFVMLACIIVGKVENDNDCWKLVLTMPVSKLKIYLAKFSAMLVITAIMFISFLVQFQIAGMILGASGIVPVEYIKVVVLGFLAVLPVIAVEFILARNFKSISMPLAAGMFLTGSGFLITQSSYWKYAPWTYCNYTFFTDFTGATVKSFLYIGVAIVIFIIAIMVDMAIFKTRDV